MTHTQSTQELPPFPVIEGVRFSHVPGYLGYAASDDGRVWLCRKPFLAWEEPKTRIGSGGYIYTKIHRKTVAAHTLVLTAFVGPRPPGMLCRHFPDRNPANNRLSNIQWGTYKENHADKTVHGTATQTQGVLNGSSRFTEDEIRQIREEVAKGKSKYQVAKMFKTDGSTVSKIVLRKRWKHIH